MAKKKTHVDVGVGSGFKIGIGLALWKGFAWLLFFVLVALFMYRS